MLVSPAPKISAPPPELVLDCAGTLSYDTQPDGTATRGQVVTNQMATDRALANCRSVQQALLKAWPHN